MLGRCEVKRWSGVWFDLITNSRFTVGIGTHDTALEEKASTKDVRVMSDNEFSAEEWGEFQITVDRIEAEMTQEQAEAGKVQEESSEDDGSIDAAFFDALISLCCKAGMRGWNTKIVARVVQNATEEAIAKLLQHEYGDKEAEYFVQLSLNNRFDNFREMAQTYPRSVMEKQCRRQCVGLGLLITFVEAGKTEGGYVDPSSYIPFLASTLQSLTGYLLNSTSSRADSSHT